MKTRIFGLLLLLALLPACQSVNGSSENQHGAYYVGGKHLPGKEFTTDTNDVLGDRDLSKTTLIIYNHGTSNGGIHQMCWTDRMPRYVRQLTYEDSNIVVYYFCSQESSGWAAGSIVNQVFYKRSVEIGELSVKFQELGIPKDNIFLIGHSGGASASLMAASRTPEEFNSYIVTAPGYGYAYLGAKAQHLSYGAIYDNWKRIIQRGTKSKGIVFAFLGDKYSPASDLDFMGDMKNVELRVLSNKDDPLCGVEKIHYYPWSDCFEREQTEAILSYIQRHRVSQGGV